MKSMVFDQILGDKTGYHQKGISRGAVQGGFGQKLIGFITPKKDTIGAHLNKSRMAQIPGSSEEL